MHDVEFQPADPPDLTDARLDHAVVILPQRMEGEEGVYRDEQLTLAKELRGEGVDADYAQDADHRLWHGLKGGDVLIQVTLGLGTSIVGSAVVGVVAAVLRRKFGGRRLHLKVGRISASGAVDAQWFEAEGDADDVLNALDRFQFPEQLDGGDES